MGYIYKIVNIVNGTEYIGQTKHDLNIREYYHFRSKSNCRLLREAIAEYGKQNFYVKLILICFDSDMNIYEREYIKKYNTLYPNGYNIRQGGSYGNHSEETKRIISKSLKGRVGHRSNLGNKLTEEHKKKISASLTGRTVTPEAIANNRENHFHKNVIMYDIYGDILDKFQSCKLAAESINVTKSAISMACNGKRKTVKGYIFKFATDDLTVNSRA